MKIILFFLLQLHQAVHVAHKATASLGKFQPKLGKVKPPKGTGKKRKFDPLISKGEKSKNLDVLEKIMNKRPKIDVEKAMSKVTGPSRKKGNDDG